MELNLGYDIGACIDVTVEFEAFTTLSKHQMPGVGKWLCSYHLSDTRSAVVGHLELSPEIGWITAIRCLLFIPVPRNITAPVDQSHSTGGHPGQWFHEALETSIAAGNAAWI